MPSGFSWREFAKMCGYTSPVYLKLVAEGKTALSAVGVERVALALGLAAHDLEYFRLLVTFAESKDTKKRDHAYRAMRAIAEKSAVHVVGADQYDFYQEWYHSAIRELAPAHPLATEEQLASMLNPKIPVAKVHQSLELLQRIGMLSRNEQGHWIQNDRVISTGQNVQSLAVRGLHRKMADLGVRSLDEVSRTERDISGLTLGLTQEAFDRILHELAEFRTRILAIASEDSAMDRVYRLNLQLFPLSNAPTSRESK